MCMATYILKPTVTHLTGEVHRSADPVGTLCQLLKEAKVDDDEDYACASEPSSEKYIAVDRYLGFSLAR